jgi:hypothetical protein
MPKFKVLFSVVKQDKETVPKRTQKGSQKGPKRAHSKPNTKFGGEEDPDFWWFGGLNIEVKSKSHLPITLAIPAISNQQQSCRNWIP